MYGLRFPSSNGHAAHDQMDTLEKLVSNHEHLTFLSDDCVKCTLTNHEMKATVEIVKKHLKSKSFRKASWYAIRLLAFGTVHRRAQERSEEEALRSRHAPSFEQNSETSRSTHKR